MNIAEKIEKHQSTLIEIELDLNLALADSTNKVEIAQLRQRKTTLLEELEFFLILDTLADWMLEANQENDL